MSTLVLKNPQAQTTPYLLIGYDMIDRHVGFEAAGVFSILKDVATFHAVSLAIRLKSPELYEKNLVPSCSKTGSEVEVLDIEYIQEIVNWLREIPELSSYMDRLEKAIVESSPFGLKDIREPWATIVHLDIWSNNVMVTNEDKPKNMILDWQMPQQGSAAADLIFFLFTSVKFDIIKERLDEFIKFYYGEFIENLKQLKVDTTNYTFEGFLEEIVIEGKFGEFGHILGHVHTILLEKGNALFDASDANYTHEDFKKPDQDKLNERQIEKFEWVCLEFMKRNWI